MSNSTDPRQELSSTYFVQDKGNRDELARLQIADQMTTNSMGGVLPEQPDPTLFEKVLDVGCGTGGWLIEAAKTYPTMKLLVGVDISGKMVQYARKQAEAQGVSDRVEFHVMDALRRLEFPDGYFDLVNQRYGAGFLRTWDWPGILMEYQRVTRRGGVIRITECDYITVSSSPALLRLCQLGMAAFHQSGHFYTPQPDGVTSQLVRLLSQYGVQNVQTRPHTMSYPPDTPEGQNFAENLRLYYRTLQPFMRRWIRVPDDYDAIYQQALAEMQQPDFTAAWDFLTAWGTSRGPD
jgi:ubiquinone/menaquinone biosynthesis C-methylase UbiE